MLLIVVLALIIGTLAVANTMLAAVLERRRELALLSTIGWSAGRSSAWLVLGEAVAVSMIGTGCGLALGAIASGALPTGARARELHHPRPDRLGARPRVPDRRRDRRARRGLPDLARDADVVRARARAGLTAVGLLDDPAVDQRHDPVGALATPRGRG